MCQGGNGVPISQPPALEQEGSTRGALGVGVGAVGDWGWGGGVPSCLLACSTRGSSCSWLYLRTASRSIRSSGLSSSSSARGSPQWKAAGGRRGGGGGSVPVGTACVGAAPTCGVSTGGISRFGTPPHTQTHFGDLPPHSLSPHRHLAAPLTTRGGQHQRDPPLLGGVLTPLHSPRVGAAVPPQRTPLSAERSNGATKRSAMEPEGEGGGG